GVDLVGRAERAHVEVRVSGQAPEIQNAEREHEQVLAAEHEQLQGEQDRHAAGRGHAIEPGEERRHPRAPSRSRRDTPSICSTKSAPNAAAGVKAPASGRSPSRLAASTMAAAANAYPSPI